MLFRVVSVVRGFSVVRAPSTQKLSKNNHEIHETHETHEEKILPYSVGNIFFAGMAASTISSSFANIGM